MAYDTSMGQFIARDIILMSGLYSLVDGADLAGTDKYSCQILFFDGWREPSCPCACEELSWVRDERRGKNLGLSWLATSIT